MLWIDAINSKLNNAASLFRISSVQRNDWSFQLGFHKTWDLHAYIHLPGDEIWLSYLAFPFELVYFRLNTNSSDRTKSLDVSIREKEIFTLDKVGSPCKSYLQQV
jgi:hypothetical protein